MRDESYVDKLTVGEKGRELGKYETGKTWAEIQSGQIRKGKFVYIYMWVYAANSTYFSFKYYAQSLNIKLSA